MSEPIRLQKLIANAGICSRRDAEALIEQGQVRVNGKTAALGDKALPSDAIFVENRPLPRFTPEVLTLAMHKPRGVLCSNEDPHHERTIFDLLPPTLAKVRLFCAGRLDKDSEGLLILTNDGALANRLTHPTNRIVKRYRVLLNRPFDRADIPRLLEGVMDEGELLKAEKVIPAPRGGPDVACRLEVHLNHGKKREIRRLFEANRYFVKRLQRFQIGGLVLKHLPRGAVRELKPQEIEKLLTAD